MATINPYLTLDGTCEEAFNFYKSVFGGEFTYLSKFGEMPPQEGMPPLSDEVKNRILHISLRISPDTILMGSDFIPGTHQQIIGNNISISIDTKSQVEAGQIFNGLAAKAKITMPLEETFWGAYFGMLTDDFGINWMVNYDDPAKIQPH